MAIFNDPTLSYVKIHKKYTKYVVKEVFWSEKKSRLLALFTCFTHIFLIIFCINYIPEFLFDADIARMKNYSILINGLPNSREMEKRTQFNAVCFLSRNRVVY